MSSIQEILKDSRASMDKDIAHVKHEFSSVRSGKATPNMLDTVRVEMYGQQMQLNQVATINAPEPRLLIVTPFDKSQIKVIEKSIRESGLGLEPSTQSGFIRVPLPAMNEQRRKELVKVLHRLGEEIKTGVRNIRRDANEDVKKLEKAKEGHISEDAAKKALDDIQKLTDAHTKEIEEALKHKEAEILKV